MYKHSIFQILFCSIISGVAYASAPNNITEEEFTLLPKYCAYTQSFKYGITAGAQNHPQAEAWLNTIGPGFWHLHHYCWALVQIRRAERTTTPTNEKNGYRQSAIGNMEYVIRNSPDDLVLLPEILTWIGRMELKQRNPEKARQAFSKARTIKPDYWPAYYHWAEFLRSINKNQEALEIVQQGLEIVPNTKPLLELRAALEKKNR